MIEPTFLVLGAIVFVTLLVFILRSAPSSVPEKTEKTKLRKVKPRKEKKTKKNSLKKSQRAENEPNQWIVEDSNEEEEVLEFLKGKDPNSIAKQLAKSEKRSKKKQKNATEEVEQQISESDSEKEQDLTEEGYVQVSRKERKEKEVEETPKEEPKKKKKNKPFLKPIPKTPEQIEQEKKKREEERQNAREARRKEAEERRKENGEEKTQVDRPRTSYSDTDHIKYEEASVEDILNSITQSYKPAQPPNRYPTIFSRLKRSHVLKILSYLKAEDLVALSVVNHYFNGICRTESLWESLCNLQFKLKNKGKARNWKGVYRTEYRRLKSGGPSEEKKN